MGEGNWNLTQRILEGRGSKGRFSDLHVGKHTLTKDKNLLLQKHKANFNQMCVLMNRVSQVSDVAHGPLVYNFFTWPRTNDNIKNHVSVVKLIIYSTSNHWISFINSIFPQIKIIVGKPISSRSHRLYRHSTLYLFKYHCIDSKMSLYGQCISTSYLSVYVEKSRNHMKQGQRCQTETYPSYSWNHTLTQENPFDLVKLEWKEKAFKL